MTKNKKETTEKFFARIKSRLTRPCFYWQLGKQVNSFSFLEENKMNKKDWARLKRELKNVLIVPWSNMGFYPAYDLYDLVPNPAYKFDSVKIMEFSSKQLPDGILHDDVMKLVASARNLELAELVGETINLARNLYY